MLLLSIQFATYFYIVIAKERIASLVVLPPLVLGYDELYEDSRHSTESDNKDLLHTEGKQEKLEIDKQNGGDLSTDSEFLNAGTEINDQQNNHNAAKDHRKLKQNLKEVEIAGKLLLPRQLFGCDCPNGMHNPNKEH